MKLSRLCKLYLFFVLVVQVCGLRYTNEFLVKFSNDVEDVENIVVGFGLTYDLKFGTDTHKIKDESLKSNSDKSTLDGGRIARFLQTYSDKVVYATQLPLGYIKFGGPFVHHVSPRRNLLHLIKKRETTELLQCEPYYGMGIEGAWSLGYTGNNVTIAVVDVGADNTHEDLIQNFEKRTSFNFVDTDSNVKPQIFKNYIEYSKPTDHGNNMACLIAAQNGNGKCSSGVAFNASLSVLKAFKFKNPASRRGLILSMKHLANALSYKPQDIDVYSCSFTTVRPFNELRPDVALALEEGTTKGRQGRGNLFVVPAGDNSGKRPDCNVDPFVNSIHTITIGSVGVNGSVPKYAIPCACTIASAFGDGHLFNNDTMISCSHFNSCTLVTDGVSTATAIGAAIIGLTLQANKQLSWRDVMHIIIKASSLEDLERNNKTRINGAGLAYNPYFGFGLMNATEMVLLARNWTNVPEQITITHDKWSLKQKQRNATCDVVFEVKQKATERRLITLEHVVADLEFERNPNSHIEIFLISPNHTRSILLNKRKHIRKKGLSKIAWNFTTVQYWGENPYGSWKLILKQRGDNAKPQGCYNINRFALRLYGIPENEVISPKGKDTMSENKHVVQKELEMAVEGNEMAQERKWNYVFVVVLGFIVAAIVFRSYYDVQLITGRGRPRVHTGTRVEPPRL